MIESEWIKCTNVNQMLRLLAFEFKTTEAYERKLRLLMCAYARTYWDHLRLDARKAVEVAELYADGKATKNQLMQANCFDDLIGVPGSRERKGALVAKDCVGLFDSDHVWYTSEAKIVSNLIHEVFHSPFWTNPTICSQCKQKGSILTYEFNYSTKTMNYVKDECNVCRGTGRVNLIWLTPQIINFANLIHESKDFESIPILGDMLEDNGCTDEVILNHCRRLNHGFGCWVLDLILGKL